MRLDGAYRSEDARIFRREEAQQRDHQETGIEMLGTIILHKRIQAAVKALPAYFIVDGVPKRRPSRNVPGQPTLFSGSDRAIYGDPCHDFGVNEMPPRAAHFPNAVVSLLPSCFEEFQQPVGHILDFTLRRFQSCLAALEESVGNLAKNIQLNLTVSSVAGANWHGIRVARKPGQFEFREPPFAVKTVENVEL